MNKKLKNLESWCKDGAYAKPNFFEVRKMTKHYRLTVYSQGFALTSVLFETKKQLIQAIAIVLANLKA